MFCGYLSRLFIGEIGLINKGEFELCFITIRCKTFPVSCLLRSELCTVAFVNACMSQKQKYVDNLM